MFYNRDNDREKFSNIINQNNSNENTILFITGNFGVGKTAFIDNLAERNLFTGIYISVKNNGVNNNVMNNGRIIIKLYEELDRYCKNNFNAPYDEARHNFLSFAMWKRNFRTLAKNYLGMEEVSFHINTDNSLIMMKDYIAYVLNGSHFIINIEGIHAIDEESLDLLLEITNQVNQTFFIFQFTFQNNNEEILYKYKTLFLENNSNTSIIELEMLDFKEAKKLLNAKDISLNELQMIEENYKENKGNLYQVIAYQKAYTNNSIRNVLNELNLHSKDEFYILQLIYLNDGYISLKLLKKLVINNINFKSFLNEELELILFSIKSKKIITSREESIYINDSYIIELNTFQINSIQHEAFACLLNFYCEEIQNDSLTKYNSLRHLFVLCIKFKDKIIINYLPILKKYILEQRYPYKIIDELEIYIEYITNQSEISLSLKSKIYTTFVEIMINANDAKRASMYLDEIYDKSNNNHIILKSKIYLSNGQQSDISLIDKLLQCQLDTRTQLIVSLSKLQLMTKILPYQEAKKYALKLYKNNKFKNYMEYGFVITNYAEFINEPIRAIEFYNQAIEHFKNFGDKTFLQYIYSNISMSYGYLGQTKKALEYISKMEIIDRETEHFHYNNCAVMDILSGNVTKTTISYLRNALLLSIYEYEQLIIRNNLLIAYLLNNDIPNAELEYDYIINSNFEYYKNSEFLLMNYRNIKYYSQHIKSQSINDEYSNKIEELIDSNETSKEIKVIINSIINNIPNNKYFFTKLKFHPEFICYWGVPLLVEEK